MSREIAPRRSALMIAVIFEVWPANGRKDDYLAIAASLRADLRQQRRVYFCRTVPEFSPIQKDTLTLILARRRSRQEMAQQFPSPG